MTASDFERRLSDFYAAEIPRRAPDWVLRSALAAIDETSQRRSTTGTRWSRQYARRLAWLATAAAIVVGVGGMGLALSTLNRTPDNAASPTPSPTGTLAAEFRHPFTYVLPVSIGSSGRDWVVGPTGPTSWEFLIPDSEGPGWAAVGVVVLAINGGRVDPCAEGSDPVLLPDGPQAVIDYLGTIPETYVWSEEATTVSGRRAVQALLQPRPGATLCPTFSPFAPQEGVDEAAGSLMARGTKTRVTAVEVDGEQVVLWTWRHGYSAEWFDAADELIRSIRFEPANQVSRGAPTAVPVADLRLTETFTSAMHGIVIDHPAGWGIRPATRPWTADSPPPASSGSVDRIGSDDAFVTVASQPLRWRTGEEWSVWMENDPSVDSQCRAFTRALRIDGAPGTLVVRCPAATPVAHAWIDGRGYFVASHGLPSVAVFMEMLTTVRLEPDQAIDWEPDG
ncbi:MAG TPA: hypothetical protein VFO05_07625 [Candidatus Limnocylindrales bacterium]|nr:hypothetical protein [Candidatus Limnocylindrales bacterium]